MPATASEDQAKLLERDGELAQLSGAVEMARDGFGQLVVVEGPAGIGKSKLLGAARDMARDAGLRVLAARGSELEREHAYGVVRQLLELVLATARGDDREALLAGSAGMAAPVFGLGEAPATPATAATDEAAFGIVHGLYWLVANLAAREPLALIVDDAHWADGPSLRFLAYLARRVEELPVLVVVAARDSDHSADPALASLAADPAARVTQPGLLSVTAVKAVLERELDREVDPAFAEAARAATGGNPFLVGVLASAARADGLEPTAAAAADVRELDPGTAARSVLVRLARLPDDAGSLARAVAVLGDGAELRTAAELAGLDAGRASAAVEALASADLLARGLPLTFVHPLVRQAVHGDIPPADRAILHTEAAAIVLAAGGPPDRVASHLLAGTPTGEAWAVDALRRAGDEALARGAAPAAVRALRGALAQRPDRERRADVLASLGSAELLAGEAGSAVEHLREALTLTTGQPARANLASELGRALAAAGQEAAAVEELDAMIDEVGDSDRELRLRLEAEQASIGLLHRETAPTIARRLDERRDLDGATPAERLILANLAHYAWMGADTATETARLARAALADGQMLAENAPDSITYYQAIYALLLADDLDTARVELERAAAASRAAGSVFGMTAAASLSALLAFRAGDVANALTEARTALDASDGHGALTPMAATYLALARVDRNETAEGLDELRDLGLDGELPEAMPYVPFRLARGVLRMSSGDMDGGLADVYAAGAREDSWWKPICISEWRLVATVGAVRDGEIDRAWELVNTQLELSEHWGAPRMIGTALRAKGLLTGGEEGIELLRQAVKHLEASPARLELARAQVDLGAALRRAGDVESAREPLRAGLDLARRCGGTALVERAHKQLKAAGARPRRLVFSGAEALTPSERRVAELAAEGRGNQEIAQTLFVTAKTVENHLGRAYRKLGISSRRELAAALSGADA